MTRSAVRKRRSPLRSRSGRILGLLLILGGLSLLGWLGFQKALIAYHQYLLRLGYQEAVSEIPEPVDLRVTFTEWQPTRIIIPKIKVDLVVQYGNVYDPDLLNRGPVHFQISDLPGTEAGNVAIAAHRGVRWGFFTDLDLLEEGDEIYLDSGGYRFIYHVEWNRIVEPTDWSVIARTDYPALTLQTCEPKHASATHRLIVRAALTEAAITQK